MNKNFSLDNFGKNFGKTTSSNAAKLFKNLDKSVN